jgi:hypothetical protein
MCLAVSALIIVVSMIFSSLLHCCIQFSYVRSHAPLYKKCTDIATEKNYNGNVDIATKKNV